MLETSTDISGIEVLGEDVELDADGPSGASDAQLVSEVYRKYDLWRQMRRPYEIQWYLNASALRGFPDVRFNAELNQLEIKREPSHRKRLRINHIKPKYVARVSKFTRGTPNPVVTPATTDREDIFNARASQKGLEYITRKAALRKKFLQTMKWVPLTGKAFWAIRWDEDIPSKTRMQEAGVPGEARGKVETIFGDVSVEFNSAFEILPADPGIETIGQQPELIRAKMVAVEDINQKYNLDITSDSTEADLFFYQRQIADLGTRQQGIASRAVEQMDESKAYVLRIELFTAPNAKHPQGRYVVCAGQKVLRKEDQLPGGFQYVTPNNPFPFVEFVDDTAPGQFWPDAFVERLVSLQSEYNLYRSQIAENLALHMFPKLMVPRLANLAPDAYTSEGGEKIDYSWIPGLPQPNFLQPAGVIGDVWNVIQMVKKEFDDITLIYPATMGGVGGATSGLQTNLLQEAADQVHGPAILENAYAMEEAYMKIRHLMKEFYTVPRLVSVAGKNNIPEVQELSSESIDENADIIVEPDTMMPMLRSARVDMYVNMFDKGVFGNPQTPEASKRLRDVVRLGWQDFDIDVDLRDQEQAQLENINMIKGVEPPKPDAWEHHQVHWDAHTDLFKSPERGLWTPEQFKANVWHALNHMVYINPTFAIMMASEYDLQNEVAQLVQLHQQAAQLAGQVMGPQQPQGGPEGPPGGAAPQGPPPPPEQQQPQ